MTTPTPGVAAPVVLDLLATAERAGGRGAVWSLGGPRDLEANLVRLPAGERVGEHRNDEVDVLVVVVAGEGELVVDGVARALRPGTLAHVPKGTTRAILAGASSPLAYLSAHRPRRGLGIGAAPRTPPGP